MLRFIVLTLYPEIFSSFLSLGLIKKALDDGKISVETVNFRKHGIGKHRNVDDSPYGGGAGMLLRPEPIIHTLRDCEAQEVDGRLHKILVTPQGKVFDQAKAEKLSKVRPPIVLINGRFEGFDERIRYFIDEEISIGDFVMLGGEIASMAIIEAVSRLIPGVIGNESSLEHESFSNSLLEYSQYTRPFDFQGHKVPEVLVSGNHQKISDWCEADSIRRTQERRSELYERFLEKEK